MIDATLMLRPAVLAAPAIAASNEKTLSALIAAVYDAAVEPAGWGTVLTAIAAWVGGSSAALYTRSLSGPGGGLFHADGFITAEYRRLYFERYAAMDPLTAGHFYAEVGQAISTTDVLTIDELRQGRIYHEWVAPQGLVDCLHAPLEKQGDSAALLGLFMHERDGMVSEGMRHRMALLVPHVRRAVLIGKVIEEGAMQAASFGDALDGLAAGLFLVDGSGRLVHANAAGGDMLTEGLAIAAQHGRLVAMDRAAAGALAAAFVRAAAGDSALGVKGISVPITARDGSHFAAHVLPLTTGARRRTGRRYAAAAAVFVHRATLHTPAAPELIAKTFGLTLTELRVLITIVQAGSVPEAAETLGIADSTVRTHLSRVFSKTGTARQIDLVKLLAGFAGPLGN